MRSIGPFFAVCLAAGAVCAQEAPAPTGPVITRPEWIKRPNSDDLAAVFPAEALRRGISGRGVIGCQVSVEGTLQRCTVVSETPPGLGFGAAALAVAPQFRLSPQRVDGKPTGGGTIRVPIIFDLSAFKPVGRRGAPSSGGGSDSPRYISKPVWTAAATRAQMVAAYPPALKAARASGQGFLDCQVNAGGEVRSCTVLSEEPARSGTGRAALTLAPSFRLDPPRDPSGKPVRGEIRVRIPFAFSPTLLTPGTEQITRPEWGRLPEAAEVASLFPPKAKAAGLKGGEATLACSVRAGGAVTGCSVARETPPGMGFGQAALALAPSFRMSAWTSDGRPVDGASVRIPIRYEE